MGPVVEPAVDPDVDPLGVPVVVDSVGLVVSGGYGV